MKRTVIALTVLGLFMAWPVHAQNLIVNGDFEDTMPAFWTPLTGSTFGTDVFVTTDTAYSGFSSFKITKSAATAAEVGWISDDGANFMWNDAKAGTYSINAWVKTASVNTAPATSDAKIGVVYLYNDVSGTQLATDTLWADQTTASTSWTNLEGVVILSTDPEQIFVKLIMGKDATGTVYFDGIGSGAGPFNGGAEEVAGWLSWYGGKGNYTRVTDTDAHTGDYAVEMVQPDTMTSMSELVYYSRPYAAEAGEWYKIGVWIKTVGVIDSSAYEPTYIRKENIHERVNLCYFFHAGPDIPNSFDPLIGGDKFVYVDQTVASTGWTHYVVAEQAPATATGISVRPRFNNNTTGAAYFDDITVTKMVLATPPVAIEEKDGKAQYPTAYRLSQNFPNPFNPETSIQFSCPKTGWVRLDVYNILGKRVTTLVDGIHQGGTYDVSWKAVDDHGQPVASGVYIYTLMTNDTRIARKMLLIR